MALSTLMLAMAVVIQLAGAAVAFGLLRVARRRWPWVIVCLALVALASWRTNALLDDEVDARVELPVLVSSLLLVVGLVGVARAIRAGDAERERAQRLADDLAERERAQRDTIAALEESEARFRALTESAGTAIFIFQGERMRYANTRASEITGYSNDEILALNFWEVIHPDHRELVRERGLARQRGDDVEQRYQVKLLAKGGVVRWVDFSAVVVRFAGVPAVVGTAYDITDLKSAEDELRAHRERLEEEVSARTAELRVVEETFRALAENTPDVIMRFDHDHRHLYVNPVVEQQTRIPARDFIGRTHQELGFPPDLCELWRDAIDCVFKSGRENRIAFELPTGVWIDWLLIPEFGAGGVTSVITSARDITERVHAAEELCAHRDRLEEIVAQRTADLVASNEQLALEVDERRRVEEALRASEERFRTLYDNLSIGLYRTTPSGRVVMANPAFARMLGRASVGELDRIDLESDPCSRQLPRSTFRAMLQEKGEIAGLEWLLHRADGSAIHVRESATLVCDEAGRPLYYDGALEDVSAQKQLEEQLRHAHKMEALGTLAGGIAHDFNNVLMAMRGSVDLLQRDGRLTDAHRRELEIVEHCAQRAADLVRGLLAFAHRQVLEPIDLDLAQVVRETAPLLRRVLPENIALELVHDGERAVVRADRTQLEQVLMNLCANARDAMADGGQLRIGVERARIDESDPPDTARQCALLFVTDSGCGMDAATLSHAFEPFFTTKAPGKGTGMGLATVYGIVTQHGGRVRVDSTPGEGTTFRILLPLSANEPIALASESRPVEGGSETVLVAEDDSEVRHVMVEILRGLGYRVLEAADGVAALEQLRCHRGAVDLVITDVVMPRLGGVELANAARREAPGVRFLFSSGYAEEVARDRAAVEAVHFIAKPYSIDDLARKVRDVLTPRPDEHPSDSKQL